MLIGVAVSVGGHLELLVMSHHHEYVWMLLVVSDHQNCWKPHEIMMSTNIYYGLVNRQDFIKISIAFLCFRPPYWFWNAIEKIGLPPAQKYG